jgi:hypothetical protein
VLKGVAGQVLGELGVNGVAVQDDIVGEMCRWVWLSRKETRVCRGGGREVCVLKGVAGQVLGELGVNGVAVQDDIVGEMCRYVSKEWEEGGGWG